MIMYVAKTTKDSKGIVIGRGTIQKLIRAFAIKKRKGCPVN